MNYIFSLDVDAVAAQIRRRTMDEMQHRKQPEHLLTALLITTARHMYDLSFEMEEGDFHHYWFRAVAHRVLMLAGR